MISIACQHEHSKRFGKDRRGNQRHRCLDCGKTFTPVKQSLPLGSMRLPMDKAVFVLKLLLEGMSIRAIERLTGVAKHTILDLLVLVGNRARSFWEERMTGIECERVEVDEVWAFIGAKQKTCNRLHKSEEFGDAYAFTAIDPVTKLLVCFHVGKRVSEDCHWFCEKLAAATKGRLQITTDGLTYYSYAMIEAFRSRADFAAHQDIHAAHESGPADLLAYPDKEHAPPADLRQP